MKAMPRPVPHAPEAVPRSPIHTSALAMAEEGGFAHDTPYPRRGHG